MTAVPQLADAAGDPNAVARDPNSAAGDLLADLERRQDDVLLQLEQLDRRVAELLRGLGVTLLDDATAGNPAEPFAADDSDDDTADSADSDSESVAAPLVKKTSPAAESGGFCKPPLAA